MALATISARFRSKRQNTQYGHLFGNLLPRETVMQRAASTLSLYGRDGRRKYLTPTERRRFIGFAACCPRTELATLCLMLAYTGCRISEALSLTVGNIEHVDGFVSIRTLKKRDRFMVREVPVPFCLIERLVLVHCLCHRAPNERLWPLSRGFAWLLVKSVLLGSGVAPGPHCTAKGLRHAFGIHAIRSGVPLNLVQRWLGHASMATTAIYADALGAEEREIAARMWD
jgi:integrase